MMERVYIVGYNGNMARRYRACLNYLGVHHCGEDVGMKKGDVRDCDGIIIATPTPLHNMHIRQFAPWDLPILVEKPISLEPFILNGGNVQMVNQYAHTGPWPGGTTYYNCWNSGKDGLPWDVINVIGLAEKDVYVESNSPIWKCTINGKELTLNDIDNSYVKMIDAWVKNPKPNTDYILKAHKKVRQYIEANPDWSASTLDQHKVAR